MRVAILSDFHIGYERFSADAFRQAEEALRKASERADMMIICGDIFDMRAPKPEVIVQALNLFRNAKEKEWEARIEAYEGKGRIYTDMPVIAIPGTHERTAKNAENAVGLLNLAGFLADASESRVTVRKGSERVSVSALGGVSEERASGAIKEMDPQPLDGAFNIFAMHQSVYELLPFSDDFMRMESLPKGFDLYVNGHIHSKVEGEAHGKPFLIPGSTVLTQLKENEQGSKGFFVFDTERRSYEFVEISSRKFLLEHIDITGKGREEIMKEITERVEHGSAGTTGKPVMRIVLEGRLNDSTNHIGTELQAMAKKFSNSASVEISRDRLKGSDRDNDTDPERGLIENMSIKDFGMSLFLEKLKGKNYGLAVPPTSIFEMLSSGQSKEKAVKRAMEELLS